jgi:hypothetical protein
MGEAGKAGAVNSGKLVGMLHSVPATTIFRYAFSRLS